VPIFAPDRVATTFVARVVPWMIVPVRLKSSGSVIPTAAASLPRQFMRTNLRIVGRGVGLRADRFPCSFTRTPSVKVPPASTEIL